MRLPEGLHLVPAPAAVAFAAPEVEAWVRATLSRGERLYEAADGQAEAVLAGRGPVLVLRTPRGQWVVRRYRRGGRVAAPLLGERYLRVGVARPLREALASAEVRRRGIPTPRVMAGAVYPGWTFYRADLITEYVADATDLAHALFEEERAAEERARILRAVGSLVARAAAAGIEHPDLNAKNVLIDRSAGEAVPVLLDLDRCRLWPAGVTAEPDPMVERLARSLRRHAERSRRGLGRAEWGALREGAGVAGAA